MTEKDYASALIIIYLTLISLLIFLYCITVSISVIALLKKRSVYAENVKIQISKENVKERRLFKANDIIIGRSTLYPISMCLVTLLPNIQVIATNSFREQASDTLIYYARISRASAGFFNMLAFLCDPLVQNALLFYIRKSYGSDNHNPESGAREDVYKLESHEDYFDYLVQGREGDEVYDSNYSYYKGM